MKEGLYKIVSMMLSDNGKWVLTAQPVDCEISFECESEALENELFKHSQEGLWLHFNENRECNVLVNFETMGESSELMRRRTMNPYKKL